MIELKQKTIFPQLFYDVRINQTTNFQFRKKGVNFFVMMGKEEILCLTLYHIIPTLNDPEKEGF